MSPGTRGWRRWCAGPGATCGRRCCPWRGFDLFFKIAAGAVIGPLATLVLSEFVTSTGRIAVGNDEILSFLLSVRGILCLIGAGAVVAAGIYAEHGGMMLILWGRAHGVHVSPWGALWRILGGFHKFFLLGAIEIGVHMLLAAPFLAGAAVVYRRFLSSYDIYYLVTETPPVWWFSLGIGAALGAGMLLVNGTLYVRWSFALPAMLNEGLRPIEALRRSARTVKSQAWRVLFAVLGGGALLVVAPAVFMMAIELAAETSFLLAPAAPAVVIPLVVVFMALYILGSAAVSFLVVAFNASLLSRLYLTSPTHERPGAPYALARFGAAGSPRGFRWSVRGALAAGLVASLVAAGIAFHHFDFEDRVAITAHRGSSLRAPENTLSAIRLAIEDGADYAEIDVQEMADGTIILLHDKDFLRIAGKDLKVWEARYEDVKDLDIGSWFDPAFSSERIARLEDAIDLCRGKLKLNIELKYNGTEKKLAERVVNILREKGFLDNAVITSLEYKGLEHVHEVEPTARTGYIVYQSMGGVAKRKADVFSVTTRLASKDFIVAAQKRGKEVHVWTPNSASEISRFIDLGVDNIITDEPAMMRAILEERKELADIELLLIKFRNWIVS